MKLYSYVVKDDTGFAPNPFGNHCTLACCKPKIRKMATPRDWVVGTGSKNNVGSYKIIYAMKITEKMTLAEYAKDKRFECKVPRTGKIEERGDNIYYKDANGDMNQRRGYHNEKSFNKDISGEYVLISNHFYYFGEKAVDIPVEYRNFIKTGPGHRCNFDNLFAEGFVAWLEKSFTKGLLGDPYDFRVRAVDFTCGVS